MTPQGRSLQSALTQARTCSYLLGLAVTEYNPLIEAIFVAATVASATSTGA